jgi:putative membrane protein
LMALTHEGALPALGLSADPADQSNREKASEMATHVVFGIVAETVRKQVRKVL